LRKAKVKSKKAKVKKQTFRKAERLASLFMVSGCPGGYEELFYCFFWNAAVEGGATSVFRSFFRRLATNH